MTFSQGGTDLYFWATTPHSTFTWQLGLDWLRVWVIRGRLQALVPSQFCSLISRLNPWEAGCWLKVTVEALFTNPGMLQLLLEETPTLRQGWQGRAWLPSAVGVSGWSQECSCYCCLVWKVPSFHSFLLSSLPLGNITHCPWDVLYTGLSKNEG